MTFNPFNDSSNLQTNLYDNAILRYRQQQIQESEKQFKTKCDVLIKQINDQKNYLEQNTTNKQLNEWTWLINVLPRAAQLAGNVGRNWRSWVPAVAMEELITRGLEFGADPKYNPAVGQKAPPLLPGPLLPGMSPGKGMGPDLPAGGPVPNPEEYIEVEEDQTEGESEEDIETDTEEEIEESFTFKDVFEYKNQLLEGYGIEDPTARSDQTTGFNQYDGGMPQTLWGGQFIFRYWDDIVRALSRGGKTAITKLDILKQVGMPAHMTTFIKNGRKFRRFTGPGIKSHPGIRQVGKGERGKQFDFGPERNPYSPFRYFDLEPDRFQVITKTPDGRKIIERSFERTLKHLGQGIFKDKKGNYWFLGEPYPPQFPNGVPLILDKKNNKWIIKNGGNPFNV
jgi:hypothetical protein